MKSLKMALCFWVVAAAVTLAGNATTVTLAANSGYVFRGSELAIAIDAFAVYRSTAERRAMMAEASAPYDVDIILVTHNHHDHFDAALVAANMSANPDAVLVAPLDAIEDVREQGPDITEDRLHSVAPDADGPTTLVVSGLTLTVFSFPHPPEGLPVNVGYVFQLDSVTFFHPGDLDVDQASELFDAYELGSAGIDVAFLPDFMFLSAGRREPIHVLDAGCLVPSHASPFELRTSCMIAGRFFDNIVCFGDYLESVEFEAGSSCPADE